MKKYYILKRNSEKLRRDYLVEFEIEKRQRIESKLSDKSDYLLIEKTIFKGKDGGSYESYTNLWTVEDGIEGLVYSKTKNHLIYDYTGFVHPIIHMDKKPMTFEQYIFLHK